MRAADVLAVASNIRHNEVKESSGAPSKLTPRILDAFASEAIDCNNCSTSVIACA